MGLLLLLHAGDADRPVLAQCSTIDGFGVGPDAQDGPAVVVRA